MNATSSPVENAVSVTQMFRAEFGTGGQQAWMFMYWPKHGQLLSALS